MTITPEDKDRPDRPTVPDYPTGWWDALNRAWNALERTFYLDSREPWLRIVITGLLVFAAVVVWRHIA